LFYELVTECKNNTGNILLTYGKRKGKLCQQYSSHREQTTMTANTTLPLWLLEFSGDDFQSVYLRNYAGNFVENCTVYVK